MGRIEQLEEIDNSERTADASVVTQEDIAIGYAFILRSQLSSLHLDNEVRVSDQISYRRAEEYQNVLTLGILGDVELSTATLAATDSLQNVSVDGMPIHTLFFPPREYGLSLHKDDESKTLWSAEFYECVGNVITLVNTDQPIQIDALVTTLVDDKTEQDEALFPGRKKLHDLANDKWLTHEVLLKSGLPVPESLFLPFTDPDSTEQALELISQASPEGYVIKATTGSQGSYVRMFNEVSQEAVAYAANLHAQKKDVIVQRRIIPHPLLLPDGAIASDQVDHNLRVLVTIGQDPTILDAEIRYSEKSDDPVNVSRGARALKSHHLLRSLPPDMLFTMYDTSIQAAKALYEATDGDIYAAVGYIGLDVIIDQTGIPYIVEANYGNVGGLGTLSRITEAPVEAVTEKLLTSAEPVLVANHSQRLSEPRGFLEALPLQDYHLTEQAIMYLYSGHEAKAQQLLAKHDFEVTYPEVHRIRGLKAAADGDYARAIKELAHGYKYLENEVEITKSLVDSLRQEGYVNIGAGLLDYYFKALNVQVTQFSYDRAYLEYQMTNDPQRALDLLYSFQNIPRSKLQPYEQQLRQAMQDPELTSRSLPQANREALSRDEFVEKFFALTEWQMIYEEFGSYVHILYRINGDPSIESVTPLLRAIKNQEGITVDEQLELGLMIAHETLDMVIKEKGLSEEQKETLWNWVDNRLTVVTADWIQHQLPAEKVKKSITDAQLFALSLGQLRLQEAKEKRKESGWNLREQAEKLTAETERRYLYATLDVAIAYFHLDDDIAAHITDIDAMFDRWEYPESSLYRTFYTIKLQQQLGIEFAQNEVPANWLNLFNDYDEQYLRQQFHEVTKDVKKTQQKKRAIKELLTQPEDLDLKTNVLADFETFLLEHLMAVFTQTLGEHYEAWVSTYGQENADLIQAWLVEDTVMGYLEFLPSAMLNIITQGRLERVSKVKAEILHDRFINQR